MLKDIPVYDITTNVIVNNSLCPFFEGGYETWKSKRYYLKSNRVAERIVKELHGEDTFFARRRLSLSDCYWIKYDDDNVSFDAVTPYYTQFSKLAITSGHAPSSIPELVLCGAQPKEWRKAPDFIYMRKVDLPEKIHAEMLAVKVLKEAELSVMNSFVVTEKGKVFRVNYTEYNDNIGVINIINFTNLDRSLIQFDQLGIGVDGFDPHSVIEAYKKCGCEKNNKLLQTVVNQLIADAVVGNIDRQHNNSNWAIFIDNNTGKRIPSWMYDFGWANLDSTNVHLEQISKNFDTTMQTLSRPLLTRLAEICRKYQLHTWKQNAETLLKLFSVC